MRSASLLGGLERGDESLCAIGTPVEACWDNVRQKRFKEGWGIVYAQATAPYYLNHIHLGPIAKGSEWQCKLKR
jgi:hypothetical protein